MRDVRHLGYRCLGACCEAAAARRAAAAARAGATAAAAVVAPEKFDRPPDAPSHWIRGRGAGERAEARFCETAGAAAARPDV